LRRQKLIAIKLDQDENGKAQMFIARKQDGE
jgi:hypothetical protein